MLRSKRLMPARVHVFAIIVNFTIVGCGALFLSNDLTFDRERHRGSSGVQIIVCFLSAVQFIIIIINAVLGLRL